MFFTCSPIPNIMFYVVGADNLNGSIDEPVEDGDTALHLACLYGFLPCVQVAEWIFSISIEYLCLQFDDLSSCIDTVAFGKRSFFGSQGWRWGNSFTWCLCRGYGSYKLPLILWLSSTPHINKALDQRIFWSQIFRYRLQWYRPIAY